MLVFHYFIEHNLSILRQINMLINYFKSSSVAYKGVAYKKIVYFISILILKVVLSRKNPCFDQCKIQISCLKLITIFI